MYGFARIVENDDIRHHDASQVYHRKAVATTQTPRAEPISLAETRRFDGSSDEIGIYAASARLEESVLWKLLVPG